MPLPHIVGRDHRQVNGFAAFFRQRQRLREQELLDAAEQLLGFELARSRRRSGRSKRTCSTTTSRRSGLHAVQHRLQVVERVIIADRHQNASGAHAQRIAG